MGGGEGVKVNLSEPPLDPRLHRRVYGLQDECLEPQSVSFVEYSYQSFVASKTIALNQLISNVNSNSCGKVRVR